MFISIIPKRSNEIIIINLCLLMIINYRRFSVNAKMLQLKRFYSSLPSCRKGKIRRNKIKAIIKLLGMYNCGGKLIIIIDGCRNSDKALE